MSDALLLAEAPQTSEIQLRGALKCFVEILGDLDDQVSLNVFRFVFESTISAQERSLWFGFIGHCDLHFNASLFILCQRVAGVKGERLLCTRFLGYQIDLVSAAVFMIFSAVSSRVKRSCVI